MLKKYAPIVFGTILFLSVALPVHATPSNNKNFTTFSWVEEQLTELNINVINDGLVSLQNLYQNAMDRLDDIELRIDDIELQISDLFSKNTQQDEYVAQLEGRLSELETRVINLEAFHPLVPENKTIVFAENRPQPFNSEWRETTGYSNLTINVSSSEWIAQYGVHYTNDPLAATDYIGFTEQTRIGCSGDTCPATTLSVLGNYYRISTGDAAGNITATGLLSN